MPLRVQHENRQEKKMQGVQYTAVRRAPTCCSELRCGGTELSLRRVLVVPLPLPCSGMATTSLTRSAAPVRRSTSSPAVHEAHAVHAAHAVHEAHQISNDRVGP